MNADMKHYLSEDEYRDWEVSFQQITKTEDEKQRETYKVRMNYYMDLVVKRKEEENKNPFHAHDTRVNLFLEDVLMLAGKHRVALTEESYVSAGHKTPMSRLYIQTEKEEMNVHDAFMSILEQLGVDRRQFE